MYGIVIATHGSFASGLYSGFQLICGAQDNIRVIDFLEGENTDTLDTKLKSAYEELKDLDGVLFLTDLAGGTPFARATLLYGEDPKVRILSGLSFPLLYMATLACTGNLDEDVNVMLAEAKNATIVYTTPEDKVEEITDGV